MDRHYCSIPIEVLLLSLLASLCHGYATRTMYTTTDDHENNFTRCLSILDKGAPDCREDVFRTGFLPRNHDQCCKNYLRMDEEESYCWDYLFDDPSTYGKLQVNLARCRLELEPPASRRNGTFVQCRSELDEGAPTCWEEVYYKHQLPKDHHRCCLNLLEYFFWESNCLAYLFDDEKSALVLKHTLTKCKNEERTISKLLPLQ